MPQAHMAAQMGLSRGTVAARGPPNAPDEDDAGSTTTTATDTTPRWAAHPHHAHTTSREPTPRQHWPT